MAGRFASQAVRAVLSSVVAAALARAPVASAQTNYLREGDDFLNTTFIGDEPEAARLAFYKAEELLGTKQPKEAGREILKLLRSDTHGLVRYGERLVVPIETAALLFLLRLPEPVRAELAKEEEAAGGGAAPAAADGSAALRAFALRHPLSAAGERALLDSGVRLLLSGDPGGATADLERLVHWPSAWPGTTRALAAARLLEAGQRSGAIADGLLTHWPRGADATVERGGAAIGLDELRTAARAATQAAAASVADPSFTPAFRFGWPLPPMVDAPEPKQALHRSRFCIVRDLTDDLRAPVDDEGIHDLPTRAPLLLGDRIATVEPDGLHVRRLADGSECFAPLRFDFDLHLDPHRVVPVLDRAALSVQGDRLWLTLELASPVLRAFEVFIRRDEENFTSSATALYGFDLARECYVDVAVTSADLARDPELAGYVLSGPAVASGGRLLVSASRLVGKETECSLLAFDATSGAPAGHLLLARAGNIPHYRDRGTRDDVWRVVPSPVVLRDGIAYVCTNVGLMAAVRADDLGMVWGYRYHRRNPPDSEKYSRAAQWDRAAWAGRPPIALADRVVATPSDSEYAYSLARWPETRGGLVLDEPIERQERMALVGATDDTLFFVRRTGAPGGAQWSIEATDHGGSVRWSSVPFPYGERIVGLPVLTRRCLFVPTDHVIYPIQLEREGGFCDRPIAFPERLVTPPPDFAGFGDLAVSGRWLISTSALYTLVFEGAKE